MIKTRHKFLVEKVFFPVSFRWHVYSILKSSYSFFFSLLFSRCFFLLLFYSLLLITFGRIAIADGWSVALIRQDDILQELKIVVVLFNDDPQISKHIYHTWLTKEDEWGREIVRKEVDCIDAPHTKRWLWLFYVILLNILQICISKYKLIIESEAAPWPSLPDCRQSVG